MYKLIACDLDETLLNTDKEICARNIAAIKRAEREYGCLLYTSVTFW